MGYFYFYNDDGVGTDITPELLLTKLTPDELVAFCGLALMLKNAVEGDDGEYRAIAIRLIKELEEKIGSIQWGIELVFQLPE